MRYFRNDASSLGFAPLSTKIAVLGGVSLAFGASFTIISMLLHEAGLSVLRGAPSVESLSACFQHVGAVAVAVSVAFIVAALISSALTTDADRIAVTVRRALCLRENGNPLGLKDGEVLPEVSCREVSDCVYEVRVGTGAVTGDVIANASDAVSASLKGKLGGYAVTNTSIGDAQDAVTFTIEDVTEPRGLTFTCPETLTPPNPTTLTIQRGTTIDLTTSGSILVAGKTRSGKTTGIISLLLQVLLMRPDAYGSQVVIVDPKNAELSRCPHVVTVGSDGDARAILEAMRSFAESVTARQAHLNDLSRENG
jgi:hypothetical protein